jgi:hypothetical protein
MKKDDIVKLSAEGLRIFNREKKGIKPEDRRGRLLNTGRDAAKPMDAGCVRVWWDHHAAPETIAAVFVEPA